MTYQVIRVISSLTYRTIDEVIEKRKKTIYVRSARRKESEKDT